MALASVAVLYVACGLGCAIASMSRPPRSFLDAVIVVPLWPLFGPFLFIRSTGSEPGMAGLLPGPEAVAPLRERLSASKRRLADIDALLRKPSFDLDSVNRRLVSLSAAGASKLAVASALSRRKAIERLAVRRKTLATELEELGELFLQLETQTEVFRVAGHVDESVSDLVADIQARLEGIDEIEAETREPISLGQT